METANLIKQTKSYCPQCLAKVEAEIFEKDGKAVMKKECNIHGKFEFVLENDVDLYRKILNRNKSQALEKEVEEHILIIPITYKCNLSCQFCYLPYVKDYELSDEEIKSYIVNPKYQAITFGGGEPTLHPNLPDLIKQVKAQGKGACILTNTLKLADKSYLKKLKDSGLDSLIFSLNSLDDDVFQHIEGQALLALKRQALKNVRKARIKFVLSYSWFPEVNTQEFKKIFKLAWKNNSFTTELRCRIYSKVGRHPETKKITLSDFIKLLAQVTNIPVAEYLNYWLSRKFPPSPLLFHIEYYHFIFNRGLAQKLKSSVLTYPLYLIYLIKHLGFINLLRVIDSRLRKKEQLSFLINLFQWPDKETADLDELKDFFETKRLDHVAMDGSINSFFETMLLNEKIRENKEY